MSNKYSRISAMEILKGQAKIQDLFLLSCLVMLLFYMFSHSSILWDLPQTLYLPLVVWCALLALLSPRYCSFEIFIHLHLCCHFWCLHCVRNSQNTTKSVYLYSNNMLRIVKLLTRHVRTCLCVCLFLKISGQAMT